MLSLMNTPAAACQPARRDTCAALVATNSEFGPGSRIGCDSLVWPRCDGLIWPRVRLAGVLTA